MTDPAGAATTRPPSPPDQPTDVRLALEVPRWALDTYIRLFPLVVGLSLIPAAQRFTVMLWGDGFTTPTHVALEVVAEGTRVALVVLLVRFAILRDERVRAHRHLRAGRRVKAFVDRRWPGFLVQGAMLLGLTVVFDVIPERLVPLWLPASAEDLYWAILLAAKNVTIIAFTMLWMVGAARQVLIEGGRLLERQEEDRDTSRPRPMPE